MPIGANHYTRPDGTGLYTFVFKAGMGSFVPDISCLLPEDHDFQIVSLRRP
ncbi:hypothetical protein [Primorskyibacter sedentarius]|uniref:hypothetical protein n=1 Tax=Primorskyibacter sedentarius TaxID=745311 RepID=UPI003EBF178D